MIGTTLGHYKILDKLGAGGMGEVYLAEDSTLKRQVALKVLPADLASSQERLDRFQREAETLAGLDHPNIVHIHSVEEDDGVRFLTMHLVEGKTLSEIIPKDGVALEQIFKITIPLADALATAHEKGVIHRDLKPANIMVTDEGRVKVLDFGLAKLRPEVEAPEATELPTEPLTEEGRILGTVPYMSPEQLEGKAIDARSDIFSLGVILYEMVAGERPFKGDSSASLIAAIMTGSPREVDGLRPDLPNHLSRIIRHCLEKDPEHRYQSAKDVRNELKDLHREETSQVVVPTTPLPVPKASKGKRWWPLVAGVAIVLVVMVSLWLRQQIPTAPPGESPVETAVGVEAQPPMIVVLPFENLGAPEDEYFADGMTEEITSRLAAISGLGVISRTSAMQYKEKRPSLRQIGEELGVGYVLEGTVRWEKPTEGASRVRVTPQLIRVSDDVHVWSERYDRTLEEIFAVQSAVAAEVIDRIGVELLSGERTTLEARPTNNLDAYEAYLRGLSRLANPDWTEANYRMAAQMFERAVELDPDFPAAHAGLSIASSVFYWEKWDGFEERAELAKESAERALELSSDLPQAHVAMGAYQYRVQRDYDRALEEFRAAQASLPNDTEVLRNISAVMRRQGRFEEAVSNFDRVARFDPRAAIVPTDLGLTYTAMRRYEAADRSYARSVALVPDQEWTYGLRAANYMLMGDLEEARAVLEEMPTTDDPGSVFQWMRLELFDRNYEEALNWVSRMPEKFNAHREDRSWRVLWKGLIYQLEGQTEKARAAYEEALPRLKKSAQEEPEFPFSHGNLGWAYAALGNREDAVREGRRAIALLPISMDAYAGPVYVEMLAQIAVLIGDHSLALDQIETLLSVPADFSVRLLEVDPLWDPLREDPRFQALLEKYGQSEA